MFSISYIYFFLWLDDEPFLQLKCYDLTIFQFVFALFWFKRNDKQGQTWSYGLVIASCMSS